VLVRGLNSYRVHPSFFQLHISLFWLEIATVFCVYGDLLFIRMARRPVSHKWLDHSSCFPSLLYYSKAASATVLAPPSFTTTLISIGGSNSTSSLRRNPSQHAACCSFQCLSPFRKETLLSFCFLFHFTLS
jgi:hypothetical protein